MKNSAEVAMNTRGQGFIASTSMNLAGKPNNPWAYLMGMMLSSRS